MLKAALAYARRGVLVFPCEPGAKRPLTRNGHWDATKDPYAIGRWWKRWPSANVAVPTGKKSGVVVLDVDPATGGPESLAKLGRLGGPVVVPPSRTQGPYEWVDRSPPAEASWLIERLAEGEEATLF